MTFVSQVIKAPFSRFTSESTLIYIYIWFLLFFFLKKPLAGVNFILFLLNSFGLCGNGICLNYGVVCLMICLNNLNSLPKLIIIGLVSTLLPVSRIVVLVCTSSKTIKL